MKAIVREQYGPPEVLELREIDRPSVTDDDEVLVQVHAAAVNPYDWHYLRGLPYAMRLMGSGLRTPGQRVLGNDVAGRVAAVGKAVTRFRPGDEVFGSVILGGFAEYATGPADALEMKPANLTFEQAAAVPMAALTALQGLRDAAALRTGQRVLIVGASGGVGTFAVQIARALGAHVTGVCSTPNVEFVRSLGADRVVDYTRADYLRTEEAYDVVFQLAGTRSPTDCRRALTPRGTLVLSSGDSPGRWLGPFDRVFGALLLRPLVSQRLKVLQTTMRGHDLGLLKDMLEAGTLVPVVDRAFPLCEVPEAISYVERGHARGKVVITV